MVTKAEISLVKSLVDKKARIEHGLFPVEGRKIVEELINSQFNVRNLYATESGAADFPQAEKVSTKDMERMSMLKTPTSVLALVEIPSGQLPTNIGTDLTIALDDIQDPGNMGTIIRLADWFGIRNIICSPATADCFSPKVVQATMGAIFRVRIHYTDLSVTLSQASAKGIEIFGTFLEGDNIYKCGLSSGGILVMGNEGNGISSEIEQLVTRKLYIPPYPADRAGGSESLNVAIATAVACSEFRRR